MGQYISMNFLQRGFIHQVGTSVPVCELCPAHVHRPLCSCSCNPAPCLGVGEHCSSGLKNFQSSHQATSRGPCMGVEEHNLHFEGIFCRLTVGGNHRLWNGGWSCPIHSGWSYIEWWLFFFWAFVYSSIFLSNSRWGSCSPQSIVLLDLASPS